MNMTYEILNKLIQGVSIIAVLYSCFLTVTGKTKPNYFLLICLSMAGPCIDTLLHYLGFSNPWSTLIWVLQLNGNLTYIFWKRVSEAKLRSDIIMNAILESLKEAAGDNITFYENQIVKRMEESAMQTQILNHLGGYRSPRGEGRTSLINRKTIF